MLVGFHILGHKSVLCVNQPKGIPMRITYVVCPKCGYKDDEGNGNSCCPLCGADYAGARTEEEDRKGYNSDKDD